MTERPLLVDLRAEAWTADSATLVSEAKRDRILAAAVEQLGGHGYFSSKLGELVAAAGVARRTFYDHFEGKEACFLAAIEHCVSHAQTAVEEGVDPRQPWEQQIGAALRIILEMVANEPAAASLCLIEAPSATPKSRALYLALLDSAAAHLRESRRRTGGLAATENVESAIVGGIAQLISRRVKEGEAASLPSMLPVLIGLTLAPRPLGAEEPPPSDEPAFRQAAAGENGKAGSPVPAKLPPGRHGLPREQVRLIHRRRLVKGFIETVGRSGYRETPVKDIVKAASVSRRTFYEHFEDKEDCFLAVFDECIRAAEESIASRVDAARPWEERIATGVEVLLELIEEHPEAARLCLLEARTVSAGARSRYEDMLDRAAAPLREGRRLMPDAHRLPPDFELGLVGGIAWLMERRLTNADSKSAAGLGSEVTAMLLAPYRDVAERRDAAAC